MAQQIQLRNGTAAQWTSANPTLAAGELGVETDTNKFKVGTGSTAWNSLGYSAGFTWRGTWSSATTYAVNDLVTYGNASYISIQAGTNQTPGVATSYWTVVVSGSGLAIGGTTTQVQYNNAGLLAGSANLTFDGTTLTTGGLSLKGSTSGTVTIAAPAVAGTQSYTLPAGVPSVNGQALTSTTAGVLSWSTVSSPAATPTVLGTVYGSMTTSGASPYLTAVGYYAGNSNTGGGNAALGWGALYVNTSGADNTSVGMQSLVANTTGSSNVAVGKQTLQANTTASNNTAVGYQAGYSNTTGTNNTAIGMSALRTNTSGDRVTAVGYNALYNLNAGSYGNTAVGAAAGQATTTGGVDAFGMYALTANTTGTANCAFGGYQTGGAGNPAMLQNTTGYHNAAFGNGALSNNTTGYDNCAFGADAGRNAATSYGNSYFGAWAGVQNTGVYNTGIGNNTLYATGSGGSNTAVGYQAGYGITSGSSNTLIGENVGNYTTVITTGQNNAWLGSKLVASSAAVTQSILIGWAGATDKGNNTGFLAATSGVYQGNNSASWSTTSDQRLKKNIVDNNDGLNKINAVRVRNFEYRTKDEVTELSEHCVIAKPGVQLGVIAQELQQVLPDCVKQETTGVLSVDPDNLTWYMVNAIKELSAEVASLKSQLNGIKP